MPLVERDGVWYARFGYRGRKYLRSTGVRIPATGKKAKAVAKTEAEAELDRMVAEIKGGESVDALFARLDEALAKLPEREREPKRILLSERLRRGVSVKLAIADAWDAWLESPRKRRPSDATVASYRAYWGNPHVKKHGRRNENAFMFWLGRRYPNVKFMHEITEDIAEVYAAHLLKSGIAPRTYNGAIKFLQSMFTTLMKRAGLLTNVWDGITSMEKETEGRRNLSAEELKEVCSKATGEIRYLIAIGLYTGLRLGDAATLKWDAGTHIDKSGRQHRLGVLLDEGVVRVIPHKTARKKKLLSIPIHPVLRAILVDLKQESDSDGYLLPDIGDRYEKGRTASITDKIQNHFKACKIETQEKAPKGRKKAIVRVGFHSLRHSFVSLCAANNVPQHAIQELVGHGSPAMTMLYSHADDEQKANAINVLPALTLADAETAPVTAETA